ncbi:MAG: nucleotidyltransferase family protein [Anaerolineae bacterium]
MSPAPQLAPPASGRAEGLAVQIIRHTYPFQEADRASLPMVGPAEWDGMVQAARQHGLAPLLHASLRRCAGELPAPAGVMAALWETYLRDSTTGLIAYQDLNHWADRFEREGIPFVLLKGSALAHLIYPEPSLRPFGDLDLLVHPQDAARLRPLFIQEGYAPAFEFVPGFTSRFFAQETFWRRGANAVMIDLHVHLFVNAFYRRRMPAAWLWAQTTPVQLDGRTALTLTPTAQLFHLAAHYALHHSEERLLWLYDLALLMSGAGRPIDWESVVGQARAFGLVQAIQLTLERVAAVWGVTPPAEPWRQIRALTPGSGERRAFALATTASPFRRNLWDFVNLPASEAGVFVWYHLFPGETYMRTRYALPDTVPLGRAYAERLVRIARRAAGGLLRARS